MKLSRLLLRAFGPFTETEIDFGSGPATLHIVYGPNEAGKSAALRAITDLRFGIPLRSADDFLHPSSELRIAGVFEDAGGEPIGFIRRKGRGQTLSRFDAQVGPSGESLPVLQDHQQALTGGLDRTEFEAMFGLNHTRLREGGKLLLEGEGELGSALFEASSGTRNIGAILSKLDEDAKVFFNPHGRAQNATINDARRQLEEQRRILREAQTRPVEWQALNRAHEQANAALKEVDQALETLRRRENELTELRAVEPILREINRALAMLQTMASVPDLPESAREERLAAEQNLRATQKALRDAELELARCGDALGRLVIEESLLVHAGSIDRLSASAEGAARSRIEMQQQQAAIERFELELDTNVHRIAPGGNAEQVLVAVPSVADRAALDRHLAEIVRLRERLNGLKERLNEMEEASKRDPSEDASPPDSNARKALTAALRQAQALGDVGRQLAEIKSTLREQESNLIQAFSDLGVESADALRTARPLLDARILSEQQKLTDLENVARSLKDEDQRLERDIEPLRLRQRELAAQGEVVTADTLRIARKRRDEGWSLIRRAYIVHAADPTELAMQFDPNRALPEAFEFAQSEADQRADVLRADATRAAGFEETAVRIETMEKRRRAIAVELAELAARQGELQKLWSSTLSDAGLPALELDALREWQSARQSALVVADRVGRSRSDRDRLEAAIGEAVGRVAVALRGVGETPQGDGLGVLIDQAAQWDRAATEADAEHRARAKSIRAREAERVKVVGQVQEAETALRSHLTALEAWHSRLFLPAESSPEAVNARLDELGTLAGQAAALGTARERQAHHRAVVNDFATQAVQLAALLGEPDSEIASDFADRVHARLTASREQDQLRTVLARDRTRAQERQRQAIAEIDVHQITSARLCAAAGVASAEFLPDRETDAEKKRQAKSSLATHRDQLAGASARSEAELREQLTGQDAIMMEAERERCRVEIAQRAQDQIVARQTEEQARRSLAAIDGSDRAAAAREAMESAAARFRSAIRPWARLRLAHALLSDALNQFRERAQAPMVAAASTYFALMTGGRYERLVAVDTDGAPVLRAQRTDGERIGIDAMSDGTADQLYLALRLAALDLRRVSHPQMPLVLDDVLITSDDERAANILRALAKFSEAAQVMLFTHHRHLIDVAHSTLGDVVLAIHNL